MSSTEPRAWHKEDIKAAIRKRGSTMNDLARANRLDVSTVRAALIRASRSGELAISRFLGEPPHVLWPDRWGADGRRLRQANSECAPTSATESMRFQN